jgi:hypothetical protein
MKAYIGRHVEFTDLVDESEIDFDPRMRAKVVDAYLSSEEDYWKIQVDFSFWEEYNKQFARPNYYDANGEPCLRWHETKFYPDNCLDTIYYTPDGKRVLFTLVPLKEIEEGARVLIEKVQALIVSKDLQADFCSNRALQEIMKVMPCAYAESDEKIEETPCKG